MQRTINQCADIFYNYISPMFIQIMSKHLDINEPNCNKYLKLRLLCFRSTLRKTLNIIRIGDMKNKMNILETVIRVDVMFLYSTGISSENTNEIKQKYWNMRKNKKIKKPETVYINIHKDFVKLIYNLYMPKQFVTLIFQTAASHINMLHLQNEIEILKSEINENLIEE